MPIELLKECQATAHDVLQGVLPQQMKAPSPCSEWSVGQVVDHLIEAQTHFVQMAGGEPSSVEIHGSSLDRFDAAAAEVLAFVSEAGFGARAVKLPFGEFTGEQFVDLVSLETLVHAWDVASATSTDTDLAPNAATHLLEVATKMMGGSPRPAGSNFAAEQIAPPTSTSADHLAAYLGRPVT
jgi:uncharacterized protein (TIGR03086 family)